MFGFLRQFVSPLSALTGAIAFQLCGFFVAWLAYLPLLCTAVWLPAALWAYESGCRSYSNAYTLARLHAYTLASLSLGMSLLAGHPQVGFYVLWAFGVYVLLRNLAARNIHLLLWGAFSLVGGVMFGAAQLLPLLEMASVSFRSGAESWALAAANRLPFDQFVRLFVPSFFGDWRSGTHLVWDFARFNFVERTGYPSVIAFLLAFVGLSFNVGAGVQECSRASKFNSARTSPL
jgi:branched-subunit amino acid transport protein